MDISFERSVNGKDEWLSPPELVKALGEFDLDLGQQQRIILQ